MAVVATGGRDARFVALAVAHAGVLLAVPSIPVIAVGLWWNANTIAHNFIHRPFFRATAANRAFSAFLSLILGIPQALWRQRHLQHHAETLDGRARRSRITRAIIVESLLVLALWAVIAMVDRRLFLMVYLPGWLLGLALCQLQGHFEHVRGTTSHYGRLYNVLFFNDGYHVEHHLRPSAHWSELPALADRSWQGSRWPAVLRWIDPLVSFVAGGRQHAGSGAWLQPAGMLEALERLVLRWTPLQRFVIDRHEQAFRTLLPALGPIERITVVGGGLFPRTALILRRLLPHAAITIVDASAANLAAAREFLDDDVVFVQAWHRADVALDADLVVLPLAYRGDRQGLYRHPPAANVIVHDWIWSASPTSVLVSWMLLKRLNLIRSASAIAKSRIAS